MAKKASSEVAKEMLKDVNPGFFVPPFRRVRKRKSRNRIAIPSVSCHHSTENALRFQLFRIAKKALSHCHENRNKAPLL
ncbi:MAG: hypothetical protein ACI4TW_01455 [Prevotella sp.]